MNFDFALLTFSSTPLVAITSAKVLPDSCLWTPLLLDELHAHLLQPVRQHLHSAGLLCLWFEATQGDPNRGRHAKRYAHHLWKPEELAISQFGKVANAQDRQVDLRRLLQT